jgi:prepilin-type N-terminal cleavage/methylation domain-containing protein
MRRRPGFTITEMLVAMALILFIMAILSEAFIAGLESFRQLKAIGDMDQKLRTAATILRHDLVGSHFDNTITSSSQKPIKLSTLTGPPQAGYFVIALNNGFAQVSSVNPTTPPYSVTLQTPLSQDQQTALNQLKQSTPFTLYYIDQTSGKMTSTTVTTATAPLFVVGGNPIYLASPPPAEKILSAAWDVPNALPEGWDADGLPSVYSTTIKLGFTVNLGNNVNNDPRVKLKRRENHFAAYAPGSPLLVGTAPLYRPPFQDPSNYLSQKAEICYRLVQQPGSPTTAPGPTGPPPGPGVGGPQHLYNLYRHQVVILDDTDADSMNQPTNKINLGTWRTQYYDFCCVPQIPPVNPGPADTWPMFFPKFSDTANPVNRSLQFAVYNAVPNNNEGWGPSNLFPIIGSRNESLNLYGADLLLTDVVSFSVRALTSS